MRSLRFTLRFIAIVQFFFGILFTFAPATAGGLLGLEPAAPGWVHWLFVMMGARFLGYGVGMLVAARDPLSHQSWINTMIGIQVIDWVATVGFLLAGDLPLDQCGQRTDPPGRVRRRPDLVAPSPAGVAPRCR